jgi:hypothetical protein
MVDSGGTGEDFGPRNKTAVEVAGVSSEQYDQIKLFAHKE